MIKVFVTTVAVLVFSAVSAVSSTLVSSTFTSTMNSSLWGLFDLNGWIYIEEKNDCAGFFGDSFSLCDVGSGLDPAAEVSPIVAKYETPDDGSANYLEEINALYPSVDGTEFGLGGATGASASGTWTYAQGADDPDIRFWAAKSGTSFTLFWEVDSLASCALAGDDALNYTPCLSGCHPHPLYVWRGVEWPGRGTKRGWMSRSVKTFRFRGRFLSSSDFSRMARPVPPKLLAMSPLPLTPSFTRAIGSTLDVVGVGDNRIGTLHSSLPGGCDRGDFRLLVHTNRTRPFAYLVLRHRHPGDSGPGWRAFAGWRSGPSGCAAPPRLIRNVPTRTANGPSGPFSFCDTDFWRRH